MQSDNISNNCLKLENYEIPKYVEIFRLICGTNIASIQRENVSIKILISILEFNNLPILGNYSVGYLIVKVGSTKSGVIA